jgi:transposase
MNDTTLLLGLPDVVVDRVEVDPDGTRVVHVTTRDTPQACPSCGVPATSVKGWCRPGRVMFGFLSRHG